MTRAKTRLPIVDEAASSLRSDGRRNVVHPADVSGRFTTTKSVVFALLLVVYLALPFVKIGGHPALFLDVVRRRFHLFGASFNANDFWLVFFLLTGIGFALIVVTTLFGRVWCGYACPQTVFLEGVFRRIERLVEGPRNERMRRASGPLTFDRIARGAVKHAAFAALCVGLAHVLVSYFVSIPSLFTMVRGSPADHPEAFAWVASVSAITYVDFAWFREQVCVIICPYGRLQSTMTDRDTLVIGYDATRGEPRGKASDLGAGDCVDCRRCVQVCPTGIDIRNGLQLDCIGCAACVDACDEVMDKLARPRGLVRYDSENGFAGRASRFLRPRVALYAGLGALGLVATIVATSTRVAFEAHLLRNAGAVFVADATSVANPTRLHLVNKRDERVRLAITNASDVGLVVENLPGTVELGPGEARYVALVVRSRRDAMRPGRRTRLVVRPLAGDDERITVELAFLGPLAAPHD